MATFQDYTSVDEFVGVVLFRFSTRQVCVIHNLSTDEYQLSMVEVDDTESHREAALYVANSRGLVSEILAPTLEAKQSGDATYFIGRREPFAMRVHTDEMGPTQLYWWYIACVDETKPVDCVVTVNEEEVLQEKEVGEIAPLNEEEVQEKEAQENEKATMDFYSYEEALQKLTFQESRDTLKRAIDIVNNTYPDGKVMDITYPDEADSDTTTSTTTATPSTTTSPTTSPTTSTTTSSGCAGFVLSVVLVLILVVLFSWMCTLYFDGVAGMQVDLWEVKFAAGVFHQLTQKSLLDIEEKMAMLLELENKTAMAT